MLRRAFLDEAGRLRGGWWIAIFFAVLTGLLLPLLFLARAHGGTVPLHEQAAVVLAASLICQGLRRAPVAELLGPLDGRWPRQFLVGALGGALLMAAPALGLGAVGAVSWRLDAAGAAGFGTALALLAAAATTEELLFRGFLFQRLLDRLGPWPAQWIMGGGCSCSPTPMGLHVAANAVQGPVLGFGVSGGTGARLLTPELGRAPGWLDGGTFGLEASLPGLLCVVGLLAVLWRWRPSVGDAHHPAG